MLKVLLKLILVAALAQVGMTLLEFQNCYSRECLKKIETYSREVLDVDWKPISIFPEENKNFKNP